MALFKNGRLKVMTYNGHVGIPIRHGALKVLRRRFRPNIALLQEVKHIKDAKKTFKPRRLLKRVGWHCIPDRQTDRAMTYIFAKKRRFDLLSESHDNITFGEKYRRELTAAVLLDRRTGREVHVSDVHTAPMGRGLAGATKGQRNKHMRQVQAYANHHEGVPEGAVSISGGDWNENLRRRYKNKWLDRRRATKRMFSTAGMVPGFGQLGGWVNLDDIFFRNDSFIKPLKRRVTRTKRKGEDHRAVMVVLKVFKKC